MYRRTSALLTAALLGLTAALGIATPASAVPADKPAVLSSWTQTSASSYSAWNSARVNPGPWAAYQFDWSTDYCSSSPDNPLGFDFRLSCHRHDFGYRNYKAIGQFSATNKARVDSAFYEDLKRVCARYSSIVQPACFSLAWTYYQAVRIFGAPIVDAADLRRAERLVPDGQLTTAG
ncbi:phospholipase [Solwaraspora sp. WMMD791]|uniref:phospholipase n=1 Tax=Solwaraspora sp. WMMD791 TaxID=3016086 RepID=UPI00249A767F|nr:phospholipase [Solwaraspora sp. WMMD791]WFE26511.1 phospholipase [Solwaraspora sp. WMMD791]